MTPEKIATYLKNEVALFRHFEETELLEMAKKSGFAAYEPDEFLLEFGEKARFLGVLLEGEAELSVTKDNGERQILNRIAAGEAFGEEAMMTGEKNVADCICSKAAKALLIPQDLFSGKIATNPGALADLSKMLVKHMRELKGDNGDEDWRTNAAVAGDDPYGFELRSNEPFKLLVVNCGSSTLKFNMFDTMAPDLFAKGTVERIGLPETWLSYESSNGSAEREVEEGTHSKAFDVMLEILSDPDIGVVKSLDEISSVAHRSALGGEKHRGAVVVTDEIIEEMDGFTSVFPLHNPPIIAGIRLAREMLPDAVQMTVFDSSFHTTIPSFAYLYALPYEYYEEKGLRRFGYHGSSHKYASLRAAQFLKKPYNKLETIVCHLGNGASVCGIDHGRSVDTTMGFSPLEGLMMGTRCGDLDPGLLLHLMKNENMGYDELNDLLNKKSGLLGLSGVSSDLREIEAAADGGHHRAMLAIKTYAYRVRKYIGAYVAAMGGMDVLVFTGGIGQGSVLVRSLACQGLDVMGICLDEKKNREAKGFKEICDISSADSRVKVLVVPADEERMIARQALSTLEQRHMVGVMESLKPAPVTIEISAHHVHLCQEHVESLFGPGHELTEFKRLSIPAGFACKEKVHLIGPKGRVDNVRILGPTRKQTQVEISMTEQYMLGIHPPIRESGDLDDTPGITLEGPEGTIAIDQGVICAMRHIHMTPEDALKMGLKDRDVVRVKVPGDRELIFGDVLVRVDPDARLYMHIDTDEANAANLKNGVEGYVEAIQLRR